MERKKREEKEKGEDEEEERRTTDVVGVCLIWVDVENRSAQSSNWLSGYCHGVVWRGVCMYVSIW